MNRIEIEAIDDSEFDLPKRSDSKKTSPWMTKYEYANLLGRRALQITGGASPCVDAKGMMEPLEIAKKELLERKIPLNIIRTLPNGEVEVWNPNKMNITDH